MVSGSADQVSGNTKTREKRGKGGGGDEGGDGGRRRMPDAIEYKKDTNKAFKFTPKTTLISLP